MSPSPEPMPDASRATPPVAPIRARGGIISGRVLLVLIASLLLVAFAMAGAFWVR